MNDDPALPDNDRKTVPPPTTVERRGAPDCAHIRIEVIEDWQGAAAKASDWEALRVDALEPSPSSESWMLAPALRYLRKRDVVKVLFMYASDTVDPGGPEVLCAVFPMQLKLRLRGMPVKVLSLWNHPYSLYPAPLLHRDCAAACVRRLFEWVVDHLPPSTLVEFPELRGESAFLHVLSDVLRLDHREYLVTDLTTRAIYRPGKDAAHDIESVSSSHHRRLRRYEKRLAELGTLTYDELAADSPSEKWLDEFVALEMSGWKGRRQTAIGCRENQSKWLRDVMESAIPTGRATMLALRLNGRAIAMKLNFIDNPGSYAFKVAYDEHFAKYSAGTLLELENIRRLHARPGIRWMDSLAVAVNPLANRVWSARTTVLTLLVAPPRFLATLVLALFPTLRLVRRTMRRSKPGPPATTSEPDA